MTYSRQRAVSDGTLQRLDLTIGYIKRADISVLLNGVKTENYTWSGTSDAVQFPAPIPNGVEVMLVRTTQTDSVINVFGLGASFTNTAMDTDFRQMLYLAQEYKEGGGQTEFFTNLDMHGYKIMNLAPATNPGDAVPFSQVSNVVGDALGAAESARQAAAAAMLAAGRADALREDLFADDGSSRVGFSRGVAKRSVQAALLDTSHSVYDYYVAGEATAEAMINRAIVAHPRVHLPAGIYQINASTGVKLRSGTILTGDGKGATILNAVLGTGGTSAELAAYSAGSVIGREFNPLGLNNYVHNGYIGYIGIVLNHPSDSLTSTAIQIGFDMRNISTYTVEHCHVGNIAPVGGALVKPYVKPYTIQGYGAVFGSLPGSNPAYAGGEKNRFHNNSVYGVYKGVVQDDVVLSGSSASYATSVRDNDIQTCHWLVAQMGQYGAGNSHIDNILQDVVRRPGSSESTYVQYYDGYNNVVRPAYVEAGQDTDFLLCLDTDANNNRVEMSMAGATSGSAQILDRSNPNSFNVIKTFGTTGTGPEIDLYNKAPRRCHVGFRWDGTNVVLGAKSGVASVSRIGRGDYLVTWETAFVSKDAYVPTVSQSTDASSNPGSYTVVSYTPTNMRVQMYIGAATADPLMVWVRAEQ